MRKLINSTYLSLDGVIAGPHLWPSFKGGGSEEGEQIQNELLQSCDIVLMGRRTYEGFAPAWMPRSGDPLSDRMNSMRKLVVSTTLKDPEWAPTEVVAGDVAERIRELKNEDGGHIVQYGFGDVSRLLLEHGLIDELRLWIHPLIVGPSDLGDLISRPGMATPFDLVDSRVLSNGIILATYLPGPITRVRWIGERIAGFDPRNADLRTVRCDCAPTTWLQYTPQSLTTRTVISTRRTSTRLK